MPAYVSHFKDMVHEQKEAIFEGYLKSQLAMRNYLLAIPEPDIGDDIWVAKNRENYEIYPAQLKSAFMWHSLYDGQVKRYVVNVKSHRLENTLRRKFLYFFGLYDPDYESGLFHIGCIPSSFFLEHWEFLLGTKEVTLKTYQGLHKNRINLHFDYYVEEKEYYAFVRPLVNVTTYFRDFSAIV